MKTNRKAAVRKPKTIIRHLLIEGGPHQETEFKSLCGRLVSHGTKTWKYVTCKDCKKRQAKEEAIGIW